MIKKAGGKPAAKPMAKFPLDSEKSILALAATVENLGANAYLGQAGNIQDKEILAAALSIHSVEAPPRRRPQPRHEGPCVRRRVRQAGDRRRGAQERQALPGLLAPRKDI